MSYIAEELAALSPADLRAWALSQVRSGHIADRIIEADALIRWIFSPVPEEASRSASGSRPAGGFQETDHPSVSGLASVPDCSSDSSSGCADGESAGELPTSSRTDDALPLTHAASVDVFPSEAKGERP